MKFYGPDLYGPPLLVDCPTCGAKIGHACKSVEGKYLVTHPHASREREYEVWKKGLSANGFVKR